MRWLGGITNWMDISLSELRELGDGQGGLACCDSLGRKESDRTEQLNNKEELLLISLDVTMACGYLFYKISFVVQSLSRVRL